MSKKNRTLNKDGSARKSGSGRKKGATSFVKVPFLDLKDYIGEKTPIPVSRVWLESLGIHTNDTSIELSKTEDPEANSIQYKLTKFDEE